MALYLGARESERSNEWQIVLRWGRVNLNEVWTVMAGEHMAILALDTVGYSRLMAADEEGTHARLKAHREELLDPAIAKYQGHVIKNTGDGLLAEFPSAVDCVACAVEIQRRMARRNQDVVPDRRLELRIGINVGDIMKDAGDIYGTGVNVAVRLEGPADPGGILISDDAYRQIHGKLEIELRTGVNVAVRLEASRD